MKQNFNLNQEKAVKWGNGPCLVLAGPGSGKTFVLTNRILNLITKNKVSPDEILVITFSRASANEMKERFIGLLSENNISTTVLPIFGTFHSIFYDILRESFGYTHNSLITREEEKKFIFEILENYKKFKITNDLINNVLCDLHNYKTSIEKNEKFEPKSLSNSYFNKISSLYDEKLYNEKKLDFHDMIFMCYKLLKSHKKELNYYQDKYKYILIDEFQDINKLQYDVVKMLCKTKNLFVVGDDDQSIYKFRGSKPQVMKDFLTDFKKAKIITLNENYRCAKIIVKFSKMVIDNNKDRFKKNLVSNRNEMGKLEIKAFEDSNLQNNHIIELIKCYQKQGINLSEMAILYRTNLLSNSIKMSLKKNKIDYVIKGEEPNIFDNFAVKDIIAYLSFAIDDTDVKSFALIANKPVRYISRDSIGYKKVNLDDLIKFYKTKDFVLKNIVKLKNDIDILRNSITALAIRYIRSNMGYDEYLKGYCKSKDISFDEVEEVLNAFEEEAIGHNDILEFLNYIKNFSEKNIVEIKNKDRISLMTFHVSKGLEFKVVFIIDANDGLIPHKKSIKENDLETERRLFYVGMTRAKDYLHIFFTTRRFGKNYRVSRFILEAIGGKNGKQG